MRSISREGASAAASRSNRSSGPLGPVLEQVVAELRAASPDRAIEAEIAVSGPVACARARIGQLLSTLLANALSHGAPDRPVRVRASIEGGRFELFVANAGDPIPAATQE